MPESEGLALRGSRVLANTAPSVAIEGRPTDWDDWLAAQGLGAGYYQTSAWAEVSAAVSDTRSFVLTADAAGRRIGGMLVSLRPAKSRTRVQGLKTRLMGRGAGSLECLGGPVLTGSDPASALGILLAELDRLARSLKVPFVRFTGPPPVPWLSDPAVADVFARFGYRAEPWLTSLVDLAPGEDALHRNLRQAARKGIRKCGESHLAVVECRTLDDYLNDFCGPYHEAWAADGRWRPEQTREAERWRIDRGRHFRFFVVKDPSGQVHATLGTMSFNGMATEIMSVRTLDGRKANLPAQDLLHWQAMLAHKASGDRYFNLAGYRAVPRDEKEAGIKRFKQKWGGREVPYPEFIRGDRPAVLRAAHAVLGRWTDRSAAER